MPNKHAAKKDLRKNIRRQARNARLKTHAKALLRKAQDLVKDGKFDEAKIAVVAFQQIADKAAKQSVWTKNAANRKKARIMKLVAKGKK